MDGFWREGGIWQFRKIQRMVSTLELIVQRRIGHDVYKFYK